MDGQEIEKCKSIEGGNMTSATTETSTVPVGTEVKMVDATILTRAENWSRMELLRLGFSFGVATKEGDGRVVAVLGHREKSVITKVLEGVGKSNNFECTAAQIPTPE